MIALAAAALDISTLGRGGRESPLNANTIATR